MGNIAVTKSSSAAVGTPSPVTTGKMLHCAIIKLLTNAAVKCSFTSQWSPIWDGWATAQEIAFRLDQRLTSRRYEEADEEGTDRETWNYVEPALLAMCMQGTVEKKISYPHKNSANERLKSKAYWSFKLPGMGGYCMWKEPCPATEGAPELDSRQLREIRANLRDLGCDDLPPYMPGLLEKYAKNKSGLRGLR